MNLKTKIKLWLCKNLDIERKGYISGVDSIFGISILIGISLIIIWIVSTIWLVTKGDYGLVYITIFILVALFILTKCPIWSKLSEIKVVSCPLRTENDSETRKENK